MHTLAHILLWQEEVVVGNNGHSRFSTATPLSYPWSNMGDSLHSDGKNELVTGYVPCGHQLPTCQKEGQHSSGADTPRMINYAGIESEESSGQQSI